MFAENRSCADPDTPPCLKMAVLQSPQSLGGVLPRRSRGRPTLPGGPAVVAEPLELID